MLGKYCWAGLMPLSGLKDNNMKAHTQTVVAVYATFEEKEEIRIFAKNTGKSMSQYLLDLHKKSEREPIQEKGGDVK